MKSADIRTAFLEFFKSKGHQIVNSSSLIPGNDPTLLFTNAGMVQFKDVFLGIEQRDYKRAVSSQRCVRAGGKHNDLENVGYTARHHTFFEMLGNFSFGDYFKQEAIAYAWEFLTEVLQIPAQKLWVTVYEKDDETADIWLKEMKVDPNRFSRCGEKDNFWSMGDTGPCGPCTEIFYDHGPEVVGGPPGSPEEDGDRYIEIWNLVFMQFNREASGQLIPLPKPSVDTGMGLERVSAVMQNLHNNYDIDLFQIIIHYLADLIGMKDLTNTSLRVIADHIRSSAFLIVDGVTPSNEGRGYVLRRIIRRALRHGHQLGMTKPFFHQLIIPLQQAMGEAYPELIKTKSLIEKVLLREEELFAQTLDQGMKVFDVEVAKLNSSIIPGDIVFKLYDTYGFPVDLTADIARERNLQIDETGFQQAMQQQRERSQAASKFTAANIENLDSDQITHFLGYEQTEAESVITALLKASQPTDQLNQGDEGIIVLANTPFYAESGGQVGDQGQIIFKDAVFIVKDTQKQGNTILHHGYVESGIFKVHDPIIAILDAYKRTATALNHSATHLLHAALRKILGDHVLQKGSLVSPERLRFDFSHFEALTNDELLQIENLVNQHIRLNHSVKTQLMTPEQAMDSGAVALFGEKYGKEVRVLSMGDFSMELCGGTHICHTGDIGLFKIISEAGIASGIRRIEAVTGQSALDVINQQANLLQSLATNLKTNVNKLPERIEQLLVQQKQLENELEKLKIKLANYNSAELTAKQQTIGDIILLAEEVAPMNSNELRLLLDQLKQKLPQAIICLCSAEQVDKVNVIVAVAAHLTEQFSAGDFVKKITEALDGRGGGKSDLAQGAGKNPANINKVLADIPNWIQAKLG